ncbi:hypothetical protein JCM9534A_80290 [Catenuloplanes indicus JCM 9534]
MVPSVRRSTLSRALSDPAASRTQAEIVYWMPGRNVSSTSSTGPSQAAVRPVIARLPEPPCATVPLGATVSPPRGTQPPAVPSSKVWVTTVTGSSACAFASGTSTAARSPAATTGARRVHVARISGLPFRGTGRHAW